MIALGVLLALTELVDWWAPVALPATVALMVKINDAVAGAAARQAGPARAATARVQRVAVGRAGVPAPPESAPPVSAAAPPESSTPGAPPSPAPVTGTAATVRARVHRRVAT